MPHLGRRLAAVTAALAMSVTTGAISPASADPRQTDKDPTATGYGGAVSTVDPEASAAAIEVLRKGGNAVDAAVAAAATLGVTEPYSAGIGGGGYFVYYDAKSGKVSTIDGRETAPAGIKQDAFIDPATGKPYRFTPELVTSGVSVGVPGTPATWERALERWGSISLGDALKPAIKVADRGFVVDETFRSQTADNQARFEAFTSTKDLYLQGGKLPEVGSVFQNHDLADTYRLLARKGMGAFYTGPLAEEIAKTVQNPPKSPDTKLPVPVGSMTTDDLAGYEALDQDPTHVNYRGYDVYGMAPSSSGGTTVGESLNILDVFDLPALKNDQPAVLHHYLEASALAFADRGKYVGDPAFVDVPTEALTDPVFGKERACELDPNHAAPKPVKPGNVTSYDGSCPAEPAALADEKDTENISTTNMTVSDKWGNVVEYTLTIEQTGGSGMVVPGRGFLLNNELTDFSTVYSAEDPNRIEPGKRPRSSMSPTILLEDGKPFLALGSPGGSTIITTVLQTIVNRIDLGMSIPDAIAAPRASQRNTEKVTAEPAFIDKYGPALTSRFGHILTPSGDSFTSASEIGAATAIEFLDDGRTLAAAEPVRRGGGSAMVVKPSK
ncbi:MULTISPECIES: gamma-glutamyltransferase [Micrococcaceae]|uniref:Glutathione hydrolase proenzyme n=1 Tax=Pseudarthrobacter defluvii TaxID=410837 RepID=A0ABT9UIH0_9MICC|nr:MULTISPECIES: gamma-glutamyltransferase [Micrococcaceae]MDE8588942.1 gamma-glutamyltransferase [Arthrobacter sp. NQ4]MDQ0119434.1 gamma-glutamyltranspeptidase/glutathione hydrolase [Pseudarthrobacter defluvii]BCW80581.1 gamma-glutamyltranspeptidase [Arthrobacter sp. NicSoilC5]